MHIKLNNCKYLQRLAKPVPNVRFLVISMHFPLQWFFDNLTSLEQVVQFPLMQKLDDLCVWGLWVHHVPNRLLCCVFFFFFVISSSGCHGADRWSLTWTTTLTKTHTDTLEWGVWVQLEVVSCQTCRQANCFHIHHTHTHWNWQATHTQGRTHTHTHGQLGKKCVLVSKSIFQGQPASLKIEDWD